MHTSASNKGSKSLKNTHTDLEEGFSVLLEFAIQVPEQCRYWKALNQTTFRNFNSKREINAKIKKLNRFYNSALAMIGYLYQMPNDNHLQKISALLNSFFIEAEYGAGLESMKLSTKINMLPVLISHVKIKYFKPTYFRRNWMPILLISTVGSWAVIKVYKSREFIYLAIKEFKSAGSQLLKVWIWEPIVRIYETIR
jgi:hypothetical protein